MRTPPRALCLILALACLVPAGRAQNLAVDGLFLSVPSRLDSDVVNRIKKAIEDRQNAAGAGVELKIVLDFNPDDKPSGSDDFGACSELARYLLKKPTVKTIAFVHAPVSRHTVLPVLACKELVMSREGRLGPGLGENEPLDEFIRVGYQMVADGRTLSPALVMKLVKRDLEVMEGTRNGAKVFVSREEADQLRNKPGFTLNKPDPILPQGLASYTAEQAKSFGLCSQILASKQEVASAYNMPLSSLKEDPLGGRPPVAALVKVVQPLDSAYSQSLQRRITRAVGPGKANLIILWLECGGQDKDNTDVATAMANWLRDLKDDTGHLPVMTVAYIPGEARDTATILAMGCTNIVMHKNGVLGDFSRVAGSELVRRGIEDLAAKQNFPKVLVRGMFDPQLTIYQATSKAGAVRKFALLTQEELDAERNEWNATAIKRGADHKLLTLPADLAKQLRLVSAVIETPTPQEGLDKLYELYGVKNVAEIHDDWLDSVREFFRNPIVCFFLVMLGGMCLILELKFPGTALPGVCAAVCFVIFFWAQYEEAHGGLTLLWVLLFVLGLALIALEIFVIPGFGVVGVSGVVLVVTSLALATGLNWPHTSGELMALVWKFAMFGGSIVGAGISAMCLAWALPHLPYFNRLILKPPGEAAADGTALPDLVKPETAALLGAIGVADTALRPAGRVKFGEELIDVVADGDYILPGTQVQVIQIEGNRIVVKAV